MRLVKMIGGLGNQMFIYAFYLQMRKRFSNVRIDLTDMMHYNVHYGYELHKVFGLPRTEFCMNQPLKKVLEFLFFRTIVERKQHGRMEPYTCQYVWPLVYFKGFYQSERYFSEVKDEVRECFTFNPALANRSSQQMMEQIQNDPQAVSIHIRRGDYLNPKHYDTIGCICQLPYYKHAVSEIKKYVSNPHFYVFSEDLDWVKANLPLENAQYIDWNKGADSWQDMMLMSCCKHHIICNSTFSWWAAWLNPLVEKTVIMPEQWTSRQDSVDFVASCGRWVRVKTE